jgi:hypothetical protein
MEMYGDSSTNRKVYRHLRRLARRLADQDETLQSVRLWPETKPALSSTYIALFLEEHRIQRALQDCLRACAVSTVVQILHLGDLPEPDLESALLTLARGFAAGELRNEVSFSAAGSLRELYIGSLNASTSVSGKVLTKLLQTLAGSQLQVLDCPCRIRLAHQNAVDDLAHSLAQLPALSQLFLHVVPRTSIEQPSIRLDSLLLAASNLECFELVAGYPEHNPYQSPIVQCVSLEKLFTQNPKMRMLALGNLGLCNRHVHALFQGPYWPEQLRYLSLPYHNRLTKEWGDPLAKSMQDPTRTNLHLVEAPTPSLKVNLLTTLNRLGRHKLNDAPEGSVDHEKTWYEMMTKVPEICNSSIKDDDEYDVLCLNVHFSLIRKYPMLAVQSITH